MSIGASHEQVTRGRRSTSHPTDSHPTDNHEADKHEPEILASYLPRTTVDWLADAPGAKYRGVDGTVLFVDVSGFTALTERLAARGKAGAEEITDVIGAVFGQLLEIACSHGADMLKWGGDAVLLLYREPASAERATRSAVLMSRAMNRLGRFKTSSGRIRLGVSISGHTDRFDLYLLGDLHRELIVSGPAASLVAELESVAEAGEVVVSTATASRLDPAVLGGQKQGGVLVLAPPEAEASAQPGTPDSTRLDVASLLPSEKRAFLVGGGEQGEHRQATVAFIEFSGVDALLRDEGPEVVAASLDQIVSAAEHAAKRYGVLFHETDIGRDGGKIVLVGGVPTVRGNDSERVLRAVKDVCSSHPAASPIRLRGRGERRESLRLLPRFRARRPPRLRGDRGHGESRGQGDGAF